MSFTLLSGRFERVNTAWLQEKASRKRDPRWRFYEAMLQTETYERYFAATGDGAVTPSTTRSGPVTSRMEILYARRCGWIQDAS
jgi:hypothetical protein